MGIQAHDGGSGNHVPSGHNRSNAKRCTCAHYVTFVDLNVSGYIRSGVLHTGADITAYILRGPNGRTIAGFDLGCACKTPTSRPQVKTNLECPLTKLHTTPEPLLVWARLPGSPRIRGRCSFSCLGGGMRKSRSICSSSTFETPPQHFEPCPKDHL